MRAVNLGTVAMSRSPMMATVIDSPGAPWPPVPSRRSRTDTLKVVMRDSRGGGT
jgi:hypothetical protein